MWPGQAPTPASGDCRGGAGGTSEVAAELAKRALLRPVGEHHPDPYYAEMESRILERVNRLGIGPQGLGGTTTALWVSIYTCGTHICRVALRGEPGLPCHPPRP